MNRTTESLFLRMDPSLVRAIRQLAKDRKMGISALAEDALKAYVSDSTSADHRAKLLQATEEALLSRVESRFNRLASNVQGLYAKEALDVALSVELVKQLLALALRDERQLTAVIQGARQEAHRRISARSTWSGPVPPEVEAQLKQAAQEKAALQEQVRQLQEKAKQLNQKVQDLQGHCEALQQGQEELRNAKAHAEAEMYRQQRRADATERRYSWALEQFEGQGMLKRRSFRDFLREYQDG